MVVATRQAYNRCNVLSFEKLMQQVCTQRARGAGKYLCGTRMRILVCTALGFC
jgi:hypothetical protein